MSALLPIIEELADAPDHAARARWLLSAPLAVLVTYQATIRNRLWNAHFPEGVEYIEAELVVARATRRDGLPVKDNPLRVALLALAEGRAFEGDDEVAG